MTLNNTITVRGNVRHEIRQAGIPSIGHFYTCDEAGLHLIQHGRPGIPIPVTGYSVDMDFAQVGGP